MSQLRVFIGSEPKTRIFEQVLRHSIRKHIAPDCDLTITTMDGPGWEVPAGLHQGTGFSLRRFMIPTKCNFRGVAVYMDADMLVFDDMSKLLDFVSDLNESGVACTYQVDKYNPKVPAVQSSMMVMNCEACDDWKLDRLWAMLRGGHDYPKFMHLDWLRAKPGVLPTDWNRLNDYVPGRTKILHYTSEPNQPTYKPDHPHAKWWHEALRAAILAGAVSKEDFEYGLSMWGVKEDWRSTNGIHPFYRKYLPLFEERVGV